MTPSVAIGIKRDRTQICLPQNLQNKRRIQKLLEKAFYQQAPVRIEQD